MRLIKLFVLLAVKIVFRFLDELIPKNPQLIILASKSGKKINSNLEVLWEHLKKEKRFHSLMLSVGNKDKDHINPHTLRGFWAILRAKYVFLSHGPGDVIYAWFGRNKIVTYVGHSINLKLYFFTNKSASFYERFFHHLEVPGYDYIVASSRNDQSSLMKCFRKEQDNIVVTGLPRNELVLNSNGNIKKFADNFKKIILYAPTFRDWGKINFFPFDDFDLNSLNEFLKQKEYLLILRGHVNDSGERDNQFNYTNIKVLNSDVLPEIQSVLGDFDLVISDYSSIYVDFLLTEKPVMFIPYDLEKYQELRGIIYNYESITPGPKVYSQKDLLHEMEMLLNNKQYYYDDRIKVKKFFHEFDGNFSQRLIKKVLT